MTGRSLLTRPALAELLRVAASVHESEPIRTQTVRAVVAEFQRLAEVGHARPEVVPVGVDGGERR